MALNQKKNSDSKGRTVKKIFFRNVTLYKCCTGYCVDLLDKLAKDIGFTYTLYKVRDEKWGIKSVKVWSGFIGRVVGHPIDRNRSDWGLSPISNRIWAESRTILFTQLKIINSFSGKWLEWFDSRFDFTQSRHVCNIFKTEFRTCKRYWIFCTIFGYRNCNHCENQKWSVVTNCIFRLEQTFLENLVP